MSENSSEPDTQDKGIFFCSQNRPVDYSKKLDPNLVLLTLDGKRFYD